MHWGGGGALQASQPPEWGLPFFFQRLLAAQPPSSGSPEGKIEVGPQKCQGSGGPFPATEAMPPIRHPWRFVYLFEEDTEGALPGHPGVPWRCPEVGKTEGHEEVGPSRGGQAPLGTGGVMYLIRTEVRQCALSQVPGHEAGTASWGPGQLCWRGPCLSALMTPFLSFRLTAPKIPEGEKVDFDVSVWNPDPRVSVANPKCQT